MPELPEVETTVCGLKQWLPTNICLESLRFTRRDFRIPLPRGFINKLSGQRLIDIRRRAKYILFHFEQHIVIHHLGMTGNWRRFSLEDQRTHDHAHFHFGAKTHLVFHDPRRFGFFDLVLAKDQGSSRWLRHLGPEPLDEREFHAEYLQAKAYGKKVPVKTFLMDQKVVVGIGNIYASEILFQAGVRPMVMAGKVKSAQWEKIVTVTFDVLNRAIALGGTSLRDYRQTDGKLGYFSGQLQVYGREGLACSLCSQSIRQAVLSGRSTYWCPRCQK